MIVSTKPKERHIQIKYNVVNYLEDRRPMKILAISDVESKYIYDYFDPKNFVDIDLVLAAGDLNANYLSFVATVFPCPVLYIHGNHDKRFIKDPPGGCICIDDRVYTYKNIRIAGIGGCMKYTGGPFQFTEREMAWRLSKLRFKFRKGFDILLTHSPAYGIGDGTDQAHIGFKSFIKLLDKYQPKFMVHGHQHLNYGKGKRYHQFKGTKIINAYGYTVFEI